ncbi:MAG: hypothetical protein L3J28_08685 [Candidatus Polarisedimenticolaceae bacterium]|nr:hypothetical protein [Candidatus Polarisedimenticolaceae bacterium]
MVSRIGIIVGLMISMPAMADAEFDQWMSQQSSDFASYQEKQDSEFSSFLQKEWKEFQIKAGMKRDKTPKPVVLPKAPKPVVKTTPVTIPKKIVSVKKRLKSLVEPIVKKPSGPKLPPLMEGERVDVAFLGSVLPIYIKKRVNISLGNTIDNKTIAHFWDRISSVPYLPLVKQVSTYRKAVGFNDWGTIQLVEALANKLYSPHSNEARLFSWYLLVKLGYAARVGYTEERIHLMLPSQTPLFGLSYFTYGGLRYYVITNSAGRRLGRLFSYDGNYPDANRKMDLYIKNIPSLKVVQANRVLKFNYAGKQHRFEVNYDKNIVAYFENYPSTQLDLYFKSTISDGLKRSLLIPLGRLMEGKSEEEAVNILLRFVQTAFSYKTDEEQFGREKYFFPEELFLYGYSDCEDRSVLFAYLVKELLGLDVVALTFPGHVATAVHFNSTVSGVKVVNGRREYVVADPTYINADVGMVMPQFKNVQPKIILISDI